MGERLNGIQEVSGSIPLISTKNRDSCSRKVHESLFHQTIRKSGYLIQNRVGNIPYAGLLVIMTNQTGTFHLLT